MWLESIDMTFIDIQAIFYVTDPLSSEVIRGH